MAQHLSGHEHVVRQIGLARWWGVGAALLSSLNRWYFIVEELSEPNHGEACLEERDEMTFVGR